LVKLLRAHGG